MVFFSLLHVSCCCTETLLQLVNPFNCPVGNLHNAIKTFLSPGLSFPFDYMFEDSIGESNLSDGNLANII